MGLGFCSRHVQYHAVEKDSVATTTIDAYVAHSVRGDFRHCLEIRRKHDADRVRDVHRACICVTRLASSLGLLVSGGVFASGGAVPRVVPLEC